MTTFLRSLRGAGLAACLAAALTARAQVKVEVTLDQDNYLAHESLIAEIRITNFSGRSLAFSEKSDWLDLAVESNDGYIVARLADVPSAEAFEVPSSARGIRRVDLAPCFNLTEPGRYTVVATVRLPQLNQEVTSGPRNFHIIRGSRLWEQSFGMPSAAGQPVEVRRYALIQSNDRKRLALYVRISDDAENRVFRVFPLGGLLSFSRPEAQVDRSARLHVLFQTGAQLFAYHVIAPDGSVAVRQTHQISSTRPKLHARESGEVHVVGGFRLKAPTDVPSIDATAGNPAPPPEPPQSSAPAAAETAKPPVGEAPAPSR